MKEYFEFLETLRSSGITNMFGAVPYLQQEFGLDRYKARDVLLAWMESYKRQSTCNGFYPLIESILESYIMYTKVDLIKAVKELLERHCSVPEIASRMHIDIVTIQAIIDQLFT